MIEMKVALQSKVIAQLIRPALLANLEEIMVVLPDIRFSTLLEVINYCTLHAEQSEDLDAFDAKFVDVDPAQLFLITHAANYLKIRSLMDLTCGALSNKIKGKTPEEIEEAVKKWKNL